MQIKKILMCFLICLFLVGCGKEETIIPPQNEDSPYIDPIITSGVIDKLDKKLKKDLKNNFGEISDAFSDFSFDFIGKKIDIFNRTVKDVFDNDVDLSKYQNGKVFIEIAATYCEHCGGQLKYEPQIKECLGDIPFIQIFGDKEANPENINVFYIMNDSRIDTDITVIQYDYDLMDILVSAGVSNTPTYLCIEDGICKMSFSAFNDKFINTAIKAGFSDDYPRDRIVDTDGKPLETFYRTYHTLKNEINSDSLDYLKGLNEHNIYLLTNIAGEKVSFIETTGDFDDGYIKKDSYSDYADSKCVIFGLTRENVDDLERDIDYINTFVEKNADIKCLVVFLDDIDYFSFNTSSVYLKTDIKLKCECVSSRSSIPTFYADIVYTYIFSEDTPSMLFIENNYITGAVGGINSLLAIDKLKDMFFGDNCITLKKNLIQNY